MARTGDNATDSRMGVYGGAPTFAADLTEVANNVAGIVSTLPKPISGKIGDATVVTANTYLLTASYADIPGLAVTLTASGRTVKVTYTVNFHNAASGSARSALVQLVNAAGTVLGAPIVNIPVTYQSTADSASVTASFKHTPSAGAYTWKVQAKASAASAVYVDQCSLVVEEFYS